MARKTKTKKDKVVKALEKSPHYKEILDRYLQLHNTLTKAKFYRLYVKDFVDITEPAFNYWTRKIDKDIEEHFQAYLDDYARLEVEKRAKEKMLATSMTELAQRKVEQIMESKEEQEKLSLKDALALFKLSKDIEAQDKNIENNKHDSKRKDYALFLFRNLILSGKVNEDELLYLENETDRELQNEGDVQFLPSKTEKAIN